MHTAPAAVSDGARRTPARSPMLLEVDRLTKSYPVARPWWKRGPATSVTTVREVSFSLAPGETLGIVGESGSGKTTVSRMLLRLVEPSSGRIVFEGRDVRALDANGLRRELRPRARMIFQDPDASLNPAYRVGEGLARAIRLHDPAATDVQERVVRLLEDVGLTAAYADKYPDQLSGGEKRRLGVSRALCTNPSLIVADEPLSGLDVVLQEHVLSLLQAEQAKRGFGLILVSHDLDRVQQVCDRVLVMYGGHAVEIAPLRRKDGVSTGAPYMHPYGIALEQARERVSRGAAAREQGRLVVDTVTREYAALALGAPQCVWSGRCAREERLGYPRQCHEVAPSLNEARPGHLVACHYPEE